MTVSISSSLVKVDKLGDYIPLFSSLTNGVDLFQKACILPKISARQIERSAYFSHLNRKQSSRCKKLLVPVFGNVYIAVTDYRFFKQKQRYLDLIRENAFNFDRLPSAYKNNRAFILEAVSVNGCVILNLTEGFKDDEEIVLKGIGQQRGTKKLNGAMLMCAVSSRLQDKESIVAEAINQDPIAMQFASERVQENYAFVLEHIGKIKGLFPYITDQFKNNEQILKEASKIDAEVLLYCSKEVLRNREFILELIKINNRLLEYLPDELKTDEEFFLEAALTISNIEIFAGNESLYNQISRIRERYKAHKSHMPQCILPEIALIIAKYSN